MTVQPKCILVGMAACEEFAPSPALTYAIELAKEYGACLTVCVLPPAFYMPITRTGGVAAGFLREEIQRLEDISRQTAQDAGVFVRKAGVACMAEHTMSPLETRTGRFVRLARVNDLAVLDASEGQDFAQKNAIEDALFEGGRPLLVVPKTGGNAPPDRIAVAWDGSSRAARAVSSALPLMKKAAKVFILTVTGEKDLSRMAPGADLATYLIQHGIHEPRSETLAAIRGDAAARMRMFVADEQIDMLVMGAFVHSRFRQDLLGGVTRSLLDDVPTVLFMAH